MSQKSSLLQPAKSVSKVLTSNKGVRRQSFWDRERLKLTKASARGKPVLTRLLYSLSAGAASLPFIHPAVSPCSGLINSPRSGSPQRDKIMLRAALRNSTTDLKSVPDGMMGCPISMLSAARRGNH